MLSRTCRCKSDDFLVAVQLRGRDLVQHDCTRSEDRVALSPTGEISSAWAVQLDRDHVAVGGESHTLQL